MAKTKITGTVSNTVTLGSDGYTARLDITATGAVLPTTPGAAGIILPATVRHGAVSNHGTIAGAYGGRTEGLTGGTGVEFIAAGTLRNTGTIEGGKGAYCAHETYAGGTGVDLAAGGSIMNLGSITGGQGGYGYYRTGAGGTGVALNGGTLTNAGAVTGGASLYPGYEFSPTGAAGLGIYATNGASIINSGLISGGAAGGNYDLPPAGGTGILLVNASLTNSGTITGGVGGYSYNVGGGGGAGLILRGASTVLNSGEIIGGQGATNGGLGGTGVYLQSGTLTNTGTIISGAGDTGVGVAVSGGVLIDDGTIAADNNGTGAGVSISGGDVIVAGTISSGAGQDNYALYFNGAGTLTIDPGAVFIGLVAADSTNADLLVLGGSAPGTLNGLGTQFTDFSTIQVASGADWQLTGPNTLTALSTLQDYGSLSVIGSLADAGAALIGTNGDLNTGTDGAILLGSLALAGGTVDVAPGGTLTVGSSLAGGAGTLSVQAGATLSGAGSITADAVSVSGMLTAQGGTLSLQAATSGKGTATIAAGATLMANSSLSLAHIKFASGGDTLSLGKPAEITSTLSNFGAHDVVDLRKLTATTFTYAGGTLTLLDNTTPVATLLFAGNYTATDFALQSDGHGGTDILYAAAQDPSAASFPIMDHAQSQGGSQWNPFHEPSWPFFMPGFKP